MGPGKAGFLQLIDDGELEDGCRGLATIRVYLRFRSPLRSNPITSGKTERARCVRFRTVNDKQSSGLAPIAPDGAERKRFRAVCTKL
jgi:hypothetical protein